MKYLLHTIASLLLIYMTGTDICAQQLDSSLRVALDNRLQEYFKVIEREDPDMQKRECDFLIETCTDSLMRQYVALTAYNHYRDSKVMGAEAVAIYVYDTWFATGKVRMKNDSEYFAAKVFADFNRMSLIGNKAPELIMSEPDGTPYVFGGDKHSEGKFRILYFYDTDCATCKVQTVLLKNFLEQENFPIELVAVYADDDRHAWEKYIAEQLCFDVPDMTVTHLWDPEISSDFQKKYGVLQTPRMFLIAPDGTITGRELDVPALGQMLHAAFDEVELDYGSEDSERFFDSILADGTLDDITSAADRIAESALAKGDRTLCRQLLGDLLYYLAPKTDERSKEGLDYLIGTYLLGRNDIWKSADDSVKVTGFAQMMDDLLSRSEPGKRLPDLKVPGVLLKRSGAKEGEFNLRRIRGKRSILLFYTDGCHVCASEKAAAQTLVRKDKSVRILMVNVDDILLKSPSLAGRLFDLFDLSSLPFILEADRSGCIIRRYISLAK